MAESRPVDIRILLGGGAGADRVASAHFIVGSLFLALGAIVEALALFALRFGGIFPLGYGRLETISSLILVIGFGFVTFTGGIYYVLPRLTGSRLWEPRLAAAGLFLTIITVLAVAALVAVGIGGGQPPIGVPWWLHPPMTLALVIPALVTWRSLKWRVEERSFVTLWFAIGAVVWMPMLYVVYALGSLPWFSSLLTAYTGLIFGAGSITMVLLVAGSGLLYYSLVKELDLALASRQLASVGMWSLGVAGIWWGVGQLVFGPGPGWLDGVAAALGLAFIIGAVANAANVSLTLSGRWDLLADRPGVAAGVSGIYLTVGVATLASLGSFRSVASVVALTAFWEAVEYAAVLGAGTLLAAGVVFPALPRVAGREMRSTKAAHRFRRLTLVGVGGVTLTLIAHGVINGYSWLAGSNSAAYVDIGEGWGAGAGPSDGLLLVAVLFGMVSLLGQLAYTSVVLGTLAGGRAVTQEVLMVEGEETM